MHTSVNSCMSTTETQRSFYQSELHFTLITEHQQSVTSAANHIPIRGFIDCPDNISAALTEHIVLLIMLLLWTLVCVRVFVCVYLRPWTIAHFTVTRRPGTPEPDGHIWANIELCHLCIPSVSSCYECD